MLTFLIVAAVLAAIYLYATIAYYYLFKNWRPLCGGSRSSKKGPMRIGFVDKTSVRK